MKESAMNTKILACAISMVTFFSVAVLPVSASNLILNGSFETPSYSSDVGLGNDPGVLLSDWISTTSDNSRGYTQNYLFGSATTGFADKVSNGSQAVLFNNDGLVTTSLSQTFATSAGTPYEVSFDLSRETNAGDPNQIPFMAQVTGSSVQNFVTPGGAAANGYITDSFFFIGTGSSTTLTFTAPAYSGLSASSPELDNVIVNSVPEPSSLVALCGLVGTGLILAARRRKS